jgi:hypothetical protein
MDATRILSVVSDYQNKLLTRAVQPVQYPMQKAVSDPKHTLAHAAWMLGNIRLQVVQGKLDKAQRWLGFVQALLWVHGVYTIAELKTHNRSSL